MVDILAYHKAVTKGRRAEDFSGYNEHTRTIKEKENQKKSPGLSVPADLLVTWNLNDSSTFLRQTVNFFPKQLRRLAPIFQGLILRVWCPVILAVVHVRKSLKMKQPVYQALIITFGFITTSIVTE